MRTSPILILLSLWGALPAFGQFYDKGLNEGLEVNEYPRTETQTNKDAAFVERETLREPVGAVYLIPNLDD